MHCRPINSPLLYVIHLPLFVADHNDAKINEAVKPLVRFRKKRDKNTHNFMWRQRFIGLQKKCNLTIQIFFFTFFFHLRLKKLKVRLNQNGFMESSIFQKMTPKIWRISIKTLRAKILQIFRVIFWKIDDFINLFWLNLTLNALKNGRC